MNEGDLTAKQCRAEALRRVRESDRLREQQETIGYTPESNSRVAHLRQTAAVFATLSLDVMP